MNNVYILVVIFIVLVCVVGIIIVMNNKKRKVKIENINTVINNTLDEILDDSDEEDEIKCAYSDSIENDVNENDNITKNLSVTSSAKSIEASEALESEMKKIREEIKQTIQFKIIDDVMLVESDEEIL